MAEDMKICMGCMEKKGYEATCKHCGYNESEAEKPPLYLKPGTILADQYIVGKVLGHGGFGITYIGFDKNLHRKVAIKEYYPTVLVYRKEAETLVIPLKGDNEPFFYNGLELFINEARNIARFDKNINIVNINNYFEENNTAYMVMELLEGGDLSNHINKRGGKLSVEESLHILFPILSALNELHFNKLFHLDISPQNILFNSNDIPILIDFGAAKQVIGEQSRSMDVIVKPGYSPIEQYTSKGNIGPWTDIYACGATLYKMITGETPPPSPDRIYKDDLTEPSAVKDLNVTPELNDAMLHALAARYEDRFKNIGEFNNALVNGIKKDHYEKYSSIIENFLKRKRLLVGERSFSDRFIHEHKLNHDEADQIEKKIRKRRRLPRLNWETEYKKNYELLLKKYPSGIPRREKKKLRKTYICSKRVSEKKAQGITEKLKNKDVIKKTFILPIGLLTAVAIATFIFFYFHDRTARIPPEKNYTIIATSGGNGSISPSGEVFVKKGAFQTFTIKPDKKYVVHRILVNGRYKGSDTTYTFDSIVADHRIHAIFKPVKYKIEASSIGNGKIYPSGSHIVDLGKSITFTIEAYDWYEVADVLVDKSSVGVRSAYRFSDIDADHTIEVTFKRSYPPNSRPYKPRLKLPKSNRRNVPLSPIFKTGVFFDPNTDDTHSWSKLEISTEDSFFDVTRLTKIAPDDCTSFAVSSKLNPDTKYYWRVKYADSHATVSEWSDIYSFTTEDIRPYEIIDPSCGDITWVDVQKLLASLGLYNHNRVDGVYGPNTEKAIKKFQKYYQLELTGRLDSETCAKLKLLAE
ncbi:MAG: protein kinase [Desulfobacterales bacterium]|nr:protein kinase [Desulfobacterales bacterium]